jgi:hypothetical protein
MPSGNDGNILGFHPGVLQALDQRVELLGIGVPDGDGGWLLHRVCARLTAGRLVAVLSGRPAERKALLDTVASAGAETGPYHLGGMIRKATNARTVGVRESGRCRCRGGKTLKVALPGQLEGPQGKTMSGWSVERQAQPGTQRAVEAEKPRRAPSWHGMQYSQVGHGLPRCRKPWGRGCKLFGARRETPGGHRRVTSPVELRGREKL